MDEMSFNYHEIKIYMRLGVVLRFLRIAFLGF